MNRKNIIVDSAPWRGVPNLPIAVVMECFAVLMGLPKNADQMTAYLLLFVRMAYAEHVYIDYLIN